MNDKFRAKKTAPPQVSVADSKIPDAGSGAWASEPIPAKTRFGPYEGKLVPAKVYTSYAWLVILIVALNLTFFHLNHP